MKSLFDIFRVTESYKLPDKIMEALLSDQAEKIIREVAYTMLKNAKRDGTEFAWIPNGTACPYCLELASRGWRPANENTVGGGHAEHIHTNCKCQYAVRLDGKSTVEGYTPKRYADLFDNLQGNTKEEKINTLRRLMDGKNALTLKQIEYILELENNPSILGARTPAEWKEYLEQLGFDVNPLGRGSLKGVAFEDGGGYRINYRGDGYLQYHPKGNHHTDEYYKISSAQKGKRRFHLNGQEKYN